MSERSRRAGSYGPAHGEPLLDELGAQSAELAKRWAIALIEGAEPEDIAAVDLTRIASDGPALVDRVLASAARGRDAADGRGDPASRAAVATLVGAQSAGGLTRALDALRTVLWEAAVEASPRARSDTRAARRLLEAGDALAAACSELLAAELDAPEREAEAEASSPAVRQAPSPAPAAPIVIVDERRGPRPGAGALRAEGAAVEPEAPAIAARDARPGQDGENEDEPPAHGPAAWIDSIGARLSASETDHRPFSVLLVELLEPFAAPGSPRGRPTLESVLEERLRARDGLSLTQERAGRYWLVAPGSDRAGAERLRDRLQDALSSGRGVAAVAIGVAVFPADAADAAGLAAQADLDLYATRSQGASAYGQRWARP